MIQIDDITWKSNDGLITFKNMDCNEFMKGLKENEFDLNLSDPPYGISINMNMGRRKGESKKHAEKKWDEFIPTDEIFDNIRRTSKNQIIFGGNYFNLPLTKSWIFWDKQVPEGVSFADGELAWTSFDKTLKKITVTYTGFNGLNEGGKIHPTEKPWLLYRKLLDLYTKPTDTILDCFGGSMSNAIDCHMERRKLTIIELDKDYFASALKRFDMYERQTKLF